MWGAVLGFLGRTVKGWVENRSEISKQKALARIQTVQKGIPGYSDEYLILVWSYPAIACFVPALEPSARAGIETFAQMPDWYQAGFMTISAAVFGIDKVFRFKK